MNTRDEAFWLRLDLAERALEDDRKDAFEREMWIYGRMADQRMWEGSSGEPPHGDESPDFGR